MIFLSLNPQKLSRGIFIILIQTLILSLKTRKSLINQGFSIKNKHRNRDTVSYHNYGAYLVWVTRFELAASTTPELEKSGIFPVIVDYFTLSSGICRFCGILSDIVLPEKCTSVHNFWRYEPKLCTKTLCTSRFVRLRTICIISRF